MSRYMHDITGSRSSNASPTISEFTRIYDNIVEPTAYLNISDLESIFSTNTAYSETTTQTTVEAAPESKKPLKLHWSALPPPPQSMHHKINTSNVKPMVGHDHNQKQRNSGKKRESVRQEQLIGNNRSNVITLVHSTASTNETDDKNNDNHAKTVSPIISMDLVDESNIATNLNIYSSNGRTKHSNYAKGHIIVGSDAPIAADDAVNERNQQYLFDSHKNNEKKVYMGMESLVDVQRRYNYNKHNFDLDCQNMTNCGNENYNDDKETTAASTEINKGGEQREKGHDEMVKLAERIKGERSDRSMKILFPLNFLCEFFLLFKKVTFFVYRMEYEKYTYYF